MTFDLERARGLRDFLQDDCAEVGDVWGEMIAEIERLRAENLELQGEVFGPDGIRANQACIIADQAASISELEIEITELKADLEQSERVIEARLEVIDQQPPRIQELEEALVEERAGAIRTESYDHCEGMYRIDLPDAMIRARQELQADGKIGPDAARRSWQITEERKAAIDRGLQFLEWSYAKNSAHDTKEQIAVLWAMLEEAGQ